MSTKVSTVVNYLNFFSALLLTSSLILWVPMQRPAFVLFFLSYVVEIFTDQKWKSITFDKRTYWIVGMLSFFLLAVMYMPFEDTSNYFRIVFERRLSLFGFGLIALFGVNKLFKLSYFFNTFIVTAVVAILYLALYRVGVSELINNPMRFEIYNLARIQWINTHMIFNFYMNMSLIFCWFILTRLWHVLKWWQRYVYIGAMTLVFLTISISEGRSGFLMGVVLMLGFLFFEIWKRRKIIGIVLALLVPFVILGVVSQKARFSEKLIRTEARFFIWKSAGEVIEKNPILGTGISDAQNMFDAALAINQPDGFREVYKNSQVLDAHNQYIQTIMEFGAIGFVLLLFLYLYPIFVADNQRRLMTFFIIATCLFQSLFDVFITNTFSVLFGLLMLLMLFVPNDISSRRQKHSAQLT